MNLKCLVHLPSSCNESKRLLCYNQPILLLLFFTAALALRSRGLVIGSREKEEEKEREEKEEEKNLQIAIRCLWDLFD